MGNYMNDSSTGNTENINKDLLINSAGQIIDPAVEERPKFDPVEVLADGCKFYGPKLDKSYTLSFSVGEYAKLDLAKLFLLPEGKVIKLRIEVIDK